MVDGKSSSCFFEKENQWETAEIPGWFSPGDFVIILKNFLLLAYLLFFRKRRSGKSYDCSQPCLWLLDR
jgi:hypothetical protein